jgi:hypothetical protein
MELDLRKTAADAAYIAVGAGVLGFQQAQVRRREAGDRIATLARDAQCAVTNQGQALRDRVNETATGGLDSATATIKRVDPRQWVEPVIGDVRTRVEPVVDRIRSVDVTAPVQALPEQLNKAVEVGRARVQSLRGQTTN